MSAGIRTEAGAFGTSVEMTSPSRTGFEWGLASLLAGGVFVVAGFLGIQFILTMELSHFSSIARSDFKPMAYGGYATVGLFGLFSLLSTISGFLAMLAAARQRQPVGMGLFGFLVGILALGLWVAAAVAWHSSVSPRLELL
jgi:hypothetical protein